MSWRYPIIAFLSILLAVTGCSQAGPVVEPTPERPSGGYANPAADWCRLHDGTVVTTIGPDGQEVDYCVFPDGTQCELGAYYRHECAPGETPVPPTPMETVVPATKLMPPAGPGPRPPG